MRKVNRRGHRVQQDGKNLAFDTVEVTAVNMAIDKLYRRTLFHLVEPKFKLPSLPDVYRSLIPPGVWNTMADATELMVDGLPSYHLFHSTIRLGYNLAPDLTLEVNSRGLLPAVGKFALVASHLPLVFGEYAAEARACYEKWDAVRSVFNILNTQTKRATAAYYWPSLLMLMRLGGSKVDDKLTNVDRVGDIPAALVVSLRDTNAFVQQHALLPPIDVEHNVDYEGDNEHGVAARLCLEPLGMNSTTIWPLRE